MRGVLDDGISGVAQVEDLFAVGAPVAVELLVACGQWRDSRRSPFAYLFVLDNGADHARSSLSTPERHDEKDEWFDEILERAKEGLSQVVLRK